MAEAAEEPQILTVEDVANDLRVSKRTVMLMAQDQELPMFKVRNRWRISRATYQEWKDVQEQRYRPRTRQRR